MATTAEHPNKSSKKAPWAWPDSMDAMIAAPEHHTVVLENEHVRVVETRIPAGDRTPVHTHRWAAVYHTLAHGHFVRRDHEDKVLFDTRLSPSDEATIWMEGLEPHSVENVGSSDIHVISVEIKD
jgi:hypothetical protein